MICTYLGFFCLLLAEPASTKENNCLNAAKACNLNDTCKKYRSAYINPCTSRVSASEICNKRKCHKALRHFFDKVISVTEGFFFFFFLSVLCFSRFFCSVQGFRRWHKHTLAPVGGIVFHTLKMTQSTWRDRVDSSRFPLSGVATTCGAIWYWWMADCNPSITDFIVYDILV